MQKELLFEFLITGVSSFILTAVLCRIIIPILRNKKAGQIIRPEGPKWHATKAGTPTMGGLSFVFAITATLLLSSLYEILSENRDNSLALLISAFYALANASVGIIDDSTKLRRKKNAGLSPRAKLIFQFVLSALFLIARKLVLGDTTTLSLGSISFDIGIFYYFVALVVLVGITNCTNLTDGIDGLASSVALAIGISLFYLSYGSNETAAFICIALAAGAIGFLFFNIHPARVFMGDTGSLFLGALIAALAFEIKSPLAAVISGSVYVVEGVSVILQVAFFKLTKRRLFKMAPLHHHLERSGWDESKICLAAIILTLLSSSLLICLR